ncbi:MAG: 50S ribosomal protein L23 [Candidatus Anoxychlamydiales bacterium]|nr:50S ribosomal protein L23 [Candidatus Anoxychlamydiales bacterium]NGX40894.1 50S ribosomal protein L23 [Candidatus Anoxychlamydiales bacterium]
MNKTPYEIIKSRYITEKANVLSGLKDSQSSKSLRKFDKPKYVFLVNPKANKKEIMWALEKIYEEKKIKVLSVNTISVHPKIKRVRGRLGKTNHLKKAIVTLEAGDSLDDQV